MFERKKFLGEKLETGKMLTAIGSETYVQGTIRTKGSIRVDGRLEGSIVDAQTLVVGDLGQIQGDINALTVLVSGKVVGNITAAKSIEILNRGQVCGDIQAPKLTIEEGAVFEGNCIMRHDEKESPKASTHPQEAAV
ncbi:MAG: polymer-forming cytoskeletal protein [Elusimicrobia bacterium]|nr:polymer-forming cytoskeletal protein [Elusimicrobiota bacterium]